MYICLDRVLFTTRTRYYLFPQSLPLTSQIIYWIWWERSGRSEKWASHFMLSPPFTAWPISESPSLHLISTNGTYPHPSNQLKYRIKEQRLVCALVLVLLELCSDPDWAEDKNNNRNWVNKLLPFLKGPVIIIIIIIIISSQPFIGKGRRSSVTRRRSQWQGKGGWYVPCYDGIGLGQDTVTLKVVNLLW